MTKRATTGKRAKAPVVPAVDLDFRETLTRLLKVKPQRPLTADEKRRLAAESKVHDRKFAEMQDVIVTDDEPD